MAAEYVLIHKAKYEHMEREQDVQSPLSSSSPPPPPIQLPPQQSTSATSTRRNSSNDKMDDHDEHESIRESTMSTSRRENENVIEDETLSSDSDISIGSDVDDDQYCSILSILQQFNDDELEYVRPILTAIDGSDNNVLTWNKDNGEIVFHQESIPKTSIVNMLKDTMYSSGNVRGKMEFYQGLAELNVPAKNIRNSRSRCLLSVAKGEVDYKMGKCVKKDRVEKSSLKKKNNKKYLKPLVVKRMGKNEVQQIFGKKSEEDVSPNEWLSWK